MDHTPPTTAPAWQQAIFKVSRTAACARSRTCPMQDIRMFRCAVADLDIQDVVLTTEEEGVAW